jgi:hypothetical protein
LGSIKDGEFLDQLTDNKLLKEDCSIESVLVLVTVKVKVKFSLSLTEHHAMKAYWVMEVCSTHSSPPY